MNIFVLDTRPEIAAQYLCDAHIKKMCVESAQMLCNNFTEAQLWLAPRTMFNTFRKHSHMNHPCSIWARQSIENFQWLYIHGIAICDEHKKRFPNDKALTRKVLNWCCENVNLCQFSKSGLTEFPFCLPDKYKTDNVVESYRNFYIEDKKFATWKLGNIPFWYQTRGS